MLEYVQEKEITMLHDLTSNQYYGGINRRFDKRSKLLRKLGFEYMRIEEWGFAVFTRGKNHIYSRKNSTLPVAFVQHADQRAFIDGVRSALRS